MACPKKTLLIFILTIFLLPALNAQLPRQRSSLDKGWKFQFGHAGNPEKDFGFGLVSIFSKTGKSDGTAMHPGFDDKAWRRLDLPHDWAVELPFVYHPSFDVQSHGYKPVGGFFPETSIGWYRKSFSIPASDSGYRYSVTFDGVFRDARFWLNGFYLGRNESGYMGVEYDITDYIGYGKDNILTVRVDATQYEGWFYEGAGIYRHVWLNRFGNLHIPSDGVFVYSDGRPDKATLTIETNILNKGPVAESGYLIAKLKNRDGKEIAVSKPFKLNVRAGETFTAKQTLTLQKPRLWNLDDPYLYHVEIELKNNNLIIDRKNIRTGIRSIRWDAERGFFLNGQPVKIKGVNMHQDHAGVGAAIPDGLQYYRINLLKRMGVNAYRASHNPPAPEVLAACDSLGLLVVDETRLLNTSPEYLGQFERLIRRDRNHPSVILWCIGNEEGWVQTQSTGKRMALTMMALQQKLDPTRTSTYAADLPNIVSGINEVIPIRSFNYREKHMEAYHRDHPHQPILGTEMGSTVTTRGIYTTDSLNCYLPDHDLTAPWWASRAEDWWPIAAENDWMAGGFIWTGMDYRGEPTPFQWPNINSHFGVMDMCGFPKNLYYYYKSWWDDKSDVLHISPHWNWPTRVWRDRETEVWINTNADSVALWLNGKPLGTKPVVKNRHLRWTVTYEPGTLEAIGFRNGRILKTKAETTGPAFELVVSPHKTTAFANGNDIIVVNVHAIDSGGREVPTASNRVQFRISGDARIIGVGNGDPSSHEPDKFTGHTWQRSLFNGKCQVILQMGETPGIIRLEAEATGLWPAATEIHTIPAETARLAPHSGSIQPGGIPANEKIHGADISFLPQLEADGMKFYDFGSETPEDAFTILKRYGFNYIRLRIFNQPEAPKGYSPGKGYCGLEQTLAMAKRIHQAGMKFLLDFHYSDYWADPQQQNKPAAWKNLPFETLRDSLRIYTIRVMQALKDQGTPPDMVQPGNEINHGFLWPEGHIGQPAQLAELLRAAVEGIKTVSPEVPVMLHVALGGQNEECAFWFDQMFARGVDCDVIGLSYYPRWHGTLEELISNMHDLLGRYGKDLVVVEYSHKKEEVAEAIFNLPDGKGKGMFIWEPLNTWERVFDWKGKGTRHLQTYRKIMKTHGLPAL